MLARLRLRWSPSTPALTYTATSLARLSNYWRRSKTVVTCLLLCHVYSAVSARGSGSEWIDIPPGKASEILQKLSLESGMQIIYSTRLLKGLRLEGVKGHFPVVGAINQMLSPHSLVCVEDESTGVLVVMKKEREAESSAASSAQPKTILDHTMKPKPTNKKTLIQRTIGGFSSIILATSTLSAQDKPEKEDEIFELSPFTVDASSDTGYRATHTLAGSRINTNLKDVAASVTVLTREFMDDVAAIDVNDVLVYTANTESTGNFTATGTDLAGRPRDTASNRSSSANRIRGLNSATSTRNYFEAPGLNWVGWDGYNIERVTVNRGPNSVIFGVGDPSGVINSSTKKATVGKNLNEVTFRFGKNSDFRTTFDFNRVLIEDKLAFRVAGLYGDRGFDQNPSFDYDRRLYFAAFYQPTENTTLNVNYETINRNQNNPNSFTPGDFLSHWDNAGRPVNDPTIHDVSRADLDIFEPYGNLHGFQLPDGSTSHFFQGAGINGMSGFLSTWQPSDPNVLVPVDRGFANNDVADFSNLNFNQSRMFGDVDIYTVSLDQKIARNLYLNLTYFGEKTDVERQNHFRGSSFNLYADPNVTLPDGSSNPNFGQVFFDHRSEDARSISDIDVTSLRATLSYDLDLREQNKWFGRYQMTAMYEDRSSDNGFFGFNETRIDGAVEPPFITNGWFDRIEYLGNLGGPISAPSYPTRGVSGIPNTFFDVESGTWQADTVTTQINPKSRSWNNTDLESKALVLQADLLQDYLAVTYGYRKDELTAVRSSVNQIGADGFLVPEDDFGDPSVDKGDPTTTIGAVFKPTRWLSFHYNESENYTPRAGAVNIMGEAVGSPTGEGEDFGFSLELMEGKLFAKFNWYEVKAIGGNPGGGPNILAAWELPFIDQEVAANIAETAGVPYSPKAETARWGSSNATAVSDRVSEGLEIEVTYNPTPNWRIMANVAQQEAVDSNVGGAINRFLEERLPVWQSLAGGGAWDGTYASEGLWGFNRGIRDWWERWPLGKVLDMRSGEGRPSQQIREWRANLVTNYDINEGKFAGLNVGGALRWQDEAAVGHPVIAEDVNGVRTPVGFEYDNPFTTGKELDIDVWVGYKTKVLNDRFDMNVSLNVRNLTDNEGFTPIKRNELGQGVIYKIDQGPSYFLTTKFSW